jgi:hypothetical protein
MKVQRGDVVLTRVSHAAGGREDRITTVIGKLSAAILVKLNNCLKAALEIP